MKMRTLLVTSGVAVALSLAPVTAAVAGGHGGHYHYYGGGPIWGLAGAVAATAAAIVTAQFALLAAIAQPPLY